MINLMNKSDCLRLSAIQPAAQPLLHLNEYKEVLKRAAERTCAYALRALEATDAVIVKNIYSATSYSGWQVNVVRRG